MENKKETFYYVIMVFLFIVVIYLFYKQQTDIAVAIAILSLIITVLKPAFYKLLGQMGLHNA